MLDAFYEFEWAVAPRYAWEDWVDAAGRPINVPDDDDLLGLDSSDAAELTWNYAADHEEQYGPVLRPVIGKNEQERRYRPMDRDHAALFREFADLDYVSKEAILAFAHKYGSLGVPTQQQSVRIRNRRGESWDHHAYGEPFLRWAVEICLMREGLRLESRKRISTESARRTKWLFDRHLQHFQGRIGFDGAGLPRLRVEPLTLISAMWLQLALAISGDKRFVACKFCRRMFEISTEQTGFRSHREFCSDSCKTKDYRKRKRTALRLAAGGTSLREVSDKTSTETATIRAWLASAKQGRHRKSGGR
jgi:hypothetical protein